MKSLMSVRSRERGQALIETAIFMPFFLLCLFGLIWAAQESSLAERDQLGVRYGGLISQAQQPYSAYSLYAMYATIDGRPPLTDQSCSLPDTSGVLGNRHSFFQAVTVPVQACFGGRSVLQIGFDNTVILQSSYLDLSTQGYSPNFLAANGVPNIKNTTVATENFFRSPDLETLICTTPAGYVIKSSLEGAYDNFSYSGNIADPVNAPIYSNYYATPYPHAPVASPFRGNYNGYLGYCTTFQPVPSPLPPDTPVPSAPPFTPNPTVDFTAPPPTANPT